MERGHHGVVLPSRAGARGELASWFGDSAQDLRVAAEANLNPGALALVESGVGVACVVRGSLAHVGEGMRALPLDPPLDTTSVLAWPTGAPMAERARRLTAFVRERA